jgi:hypothetical protein
MTDPSASLDQVNAALATVGACDWLLAGGDSLGLWVARRLAEAPDGSLLVAAGGAGDEPTSVFTLPLPPAGTTVPEGDHPPRLYHWP